MRAALPLRTAAALSAWPLAVLGLLGASGALAWGPALTAAAAVVAGALVLAYAWVRDITLIMRALHRASPDGDGADPGAAPPRPLLSATAHLAREAERLSRNLAARTAEVAGLLRAEQAIVQRLPDPLIVLGADRQVRRANDAARTAFGADMAAVLRHPGLRAAIDRAQSRGEDQAAELSLPVPVAREVYATVMALDPPLADGGRIVAIMSDRTRERAVERMRADFVANASHELRTPLASLIGFIETLRGPAADDPPAQTRFLGIMADQASRMNRLIDDLLSLSRIELTEHQAPAGRVDPTGLIQRLAAAFEPQVRERQVALTLALDADLPAVPGDGDQLEQVLQNLLDNATKYGRQGGTVALTARRVPPGGRWPARPGVVLSVADDGQGIARAHIPRLTERFYRADKGRSRAVGGTGLGLAIVKHIVNRHRGQLLIESAEGRRRKSRNGSTTATRRRSRRCGSGLVRWSRRGSWAASVTSVPAAASPAMTPIEPAQPSTLAKRIAPAPDTSSASRYPQTYAGSASPCCCSPNVSTRQASTTTSWLADRNATTTAAATSAPGRAAGSASASATQASASNGWISRSQPRRCPKRCSPSGGAT